MKGLRFFRLFLHSLELFEVFWVEGFDISSVTDNFFLSHANKDMSRLLEEFWCLSSIFNEEERTDDVGCHVVKTACEEVVNILVFACVHLLNSLFIELNKLCNTVDGRVVNIASFSVKPGQIVAVREKSKSLEVIADALAGFNHSKYPWIEWDESTKSGKLLHKPERADIPENIKEQLIVELYSKN